MRPTCKEVTELVTDYLLDELPLVLRLRVGYHLVLCRNCRRYLRQMKASVALAGELPAEPIPEAMMSELMRRFEGWKR